MSRIFTACDMFTFIHSTNKVSSCKCSLCVMSFIPSLRFTLFMNGVICSPLSYFNCRTFLPKSVSASQFQNESHPINKSTAKFGMMRKIISSILPRIFTGNIGEITCRLCKQDDETASHILLECSALGRRRIPLCGALDKKEVDVNTGLKVLDLVRGTEIERYCCSLLMGMYNKSFRLKYGRLDLSAIHHLI